MDTDNEPAAVTVESTEGYKTIVTGGEFYTGTITVLLTDRYIQKS